MSNSNNSSNGGIGFLGFLALIFITLKLCSVIAWSWLWVLSPLWIPLAFVLAIAIIVFPIAFVVSIMNQKRNNR